MAGHMMNLDFSQEYSFPSQWVVIPRNWNSVDPFLLFTAPVFKTVKEDMKQIYSGMERISLKCRADSEGSPRLPGAVFVAGLRSRGREHLL